jgi:hypothetical protein
MSRLFTPRLSSEDDERLQMRLSDEDGAKIRRGERWQATVTDLNTGIRYKVRGAACSLPHCFCDAVIMERL